MTETVVPLVDLVAAYRAQRVQLDEAIQRVLASGAIVMGPDVAGFEAAFAAYCGTSRAVGVASGTAAVQLGLEALGIGRGDTVVAPAHTFAATAEAIGHAGADPRFVDIDDTGCMDPKALLAVSDGAAAVVPVHMHGQPADLPEILDIAGRGGLAVLEDAAQAHGAMIEPADGAPARVGAIGAAGAFSFYPAKNLGAFGDAGAVTTSDPGLADRVARLRDHGRDGTAGAAKYLHEIEGYGERIDTLQAAVLEVRLRYLDEGNAARRRIARAYDAALGGTGDLRLPAQVAGRASVWHHYVVRSDDRDRLRRHLGAAGIGTGIHYPVPLHLQPAWAHLGYRPGELPVTESYAAQCLSLPIYPELSDTQQERVVEAVRGFFGAP